MSPSNSKFAALPNEVWVDILRHLPLDALWYSTRPVCTLFYHVSNSLVKTFLVDGSSCELRHYISFKDPLLSESLYYPLEPTEYQRRILEQEGHSPFSQILLWASPFPSPANPQRPTRAGGGLRPSPSAGRQRAGTLPDPGREVQRPGLHGLRDAARPLG